MSDLNQIRDHFVNLNISQLESIGDRLSNDSSIQALISSEPEIRVSTLSNVIITSLSLILNLIITVIIIIISWRSRTRRSESNGRVLNSLSVLTSEPSTTSSHHYSSLLSSQSLLTIHSILNVFSVSDLFGQLFSRNFDSHNYSIQQFNLSLLLTVVLLIVWRSINKLSSISGRSPPVSNRVINLTVSVCVTLTLTAQIPLILRSDRTVRQINELTEATISRINQVVLLLKPDQTVRVESLGGITSDLSHLFNGLESKSQSLYSTIRSLAYLQACLILLICPPSVIISLSLIKALRGELRRASLGSTNQHDQSSRVSISSRRFENDRISMITLNDDINFNSYDRGTFDSLKVPQPVLLVDSQRSLKTGGEHEEDQRRYQLTHVLNNDDTDDGERSFFEEDPGDDDQVVNEPEGGTLQERELRRKIRVSIGAAVLIGTVGCSYLMMNVSVVLNFFKYPEVTSIGRMMVIQIQWSTYSWNASVGIIYSTLVLFDLISRIRRREH